MVRFLGVLVALCAVAAAQVRDPAAAAKSNSEHFSAIPFLVGMVTGAPYSADEVSETIPPSGTESDAVATGPVVHLFRDSAGRTRTERPLFAAEMATGSSQRIPSIIEISDPVAGVRYVLDPQNKVAHKQALQVPKGGSGAPDAATQSPIRAITTSSVPTMVPPPPPGGFGAPGDSAAASAHFALPEVTVEKVGTKEIEGVAVEGTRRTVNLATNDKSLATVSEVWYSPELKITMFSKDSDPRTGGRIRRLIHVSRSEPPAALFAPPSDYSVLEETGGFTISWGQ